MKIINVEKKIGGFVLETGCVQIETGCIHGFIGSNGSGKTTLAKLIMGILEPDRGRIDYGDLTMRDITMTSQRPYLLHDTVYENIVYPLKIRRIKPDKRAVLDMLEACGMGGKEKQSARSLSSGERQKVSMLRAMCFHPRLVIIDETLSNLDPDSVDFFEKQIRKMNQEEENTWILISHRLSHIGKMCGRIHALDKGKIIQSGRAEEVLFHSPVPEVQRFLKGEMLSFPGTDINER
ncbi:MAG TPA: ABC transporter ATP-binding protein [Candidatus Blautia stercorigallinarum]|uniref:ABC transporter ATP-binding protein n=1 Tax=Candidatus Blautia stercorigallinarum TaxID=2838501 RepID=A0A9D1PFS4_9FIRM|nr:ABC transporter ATP-binding protein [Candidatus Blautia stercorigallinarum]